MPFTTILMEGIPQFPIIKEDLARPLIREILKEIEISIDEYNKYLKKI